MMYSGGRRIAAVVENILAAGGLCIEVTRMQEQIEDDRCFGYSKRVVS